MRKAVLSFWVSLDGYSVDRGTALFDVLTSLDDPEHDAWFLDLVGSAGEHAMGAQSYRDMAGYWPDSDDPLAEPMNRIPKVVFSTGGVDETWGPVRVIGGDTAAAVASLREEDGGDVLVHGGSTLVHGLLRLGLFDELRLHVLPVASGGGVPLFEDLGRVQPWRVADSTGFPSGIREVVLVPGVG